MKNKLSAWCLLLVMALTSATMQAQSSHNLETAKQLDIFNSLYRDLDLNYVDTIDAKKNIENAILFMLDQLDPYTEYFPANRNEEIKQMTTGKYAGVGPSSHRAKTCAAASSLRLMRVCPQPMWACAVATSFFPSVALTQASSTRWPLPTILQK